MDEDWQDLIDIDRAFSGGSLGLNNTELNKLLSLEFLSIPPEFHSNDKNKKGLVHVGKIHKNFVKISDNIINNVYLGKS